MGADIEEGLVVLGGLRNLDMATGAEAEPEEFFHIASGFDFDAIEVHREAADDAVADFVGGGVVGAERVDSADGEVGAGVEFITPKAGSGEGFFAEVVAEGVEEAGIEDEDAWGSPAEGGDGGSLIFGGVVTSDEGSGAKDVVFSGFFDFD